MEKKSDLLKCLFQAKTVERPFERNDEELDLAALVEEVDTPIGELNILELDENILSSIKQPPPAESVEAPNTFDTKILDDAAVIHFLSTAGVSTFEDYAVKVFLPFINQQLENADRIDIVWDTYLSSSIKGLEARERGQEKGCWIQ